MQQEMAGLAELDDAQRTEGDVMVKMDYSALCYEDPLAITSTGPVADCGLAQRMSFPSSAAPFNQRGVTTAGVDCVMSPRAEVLEAWVRPGRDLEIAKLDLITHEITHDEAIQTAAELLAGRICGRAAVNVNREQQYDQTRETPICRIASSAAFPFPTLSTCPRMCARAFSQCRTRPASCPTYF